MAFHRFKKKHPFIKRSSAFSSLECRYGAFLIDTCIIVFLQTFANYLLVGYPSEYFTENSFGFSSLAVFFSNFDYLGRLIFTNFYFLIIHWLYYALMESSDYQATIGKLALGIKVTGIDGEKISFLQATVRYFTKFLSISIFFGGFLVAFFNYRHQTLHDLISGCTVRVKIPVVYIHNFKENKLQPNR